MTAGCRWRPRWAVQLSAAYSGSSADYDYSGQLFDPATSSPYAYANTGRTTERRLSVMLLVRRILTRQPAHRVQFDALGSLTYEHLSYHEQGLYSWANPQAPAHNQYDYRGQYNGLLASLGLGLRVRVAAPLEVTFDYLLNTPLTSRQYSSTITSAAAPGVRYIFGTKQ